jgi:membrane peptidoglycan carboxypeptidase
MRVVKFFLVLISIIGLGFWSFTKYQDLNAKIHLSRLNLIKDELGLNIIESNNYPKELNLLDENFQVEYTFDLKLNEYIKKLLKRYRSDYSAIIVLDNETGAILSAVGYEKKNHSFNNNIIFSGTHPSASLFKIVTSASLLENPNIEDKTSFRYRGKRSTLYKYQLGPKRTRWDRRTSLKRAFATSNNVVFGKAAINNLTPEGIYKTANDFGFNSRLMEEIALPKSQFNLPQGNYHMAELATGFNKETLINPIHGALLSLVVANGGILTYPRLVSKIYDVENAKTIFLNNPRGRRVLKEDVSKDLKEMMKMTVKRGTARGGFRRLNSYLKKNLDIGAKTGSITGGDPHGKRDWITVFATPRLESGGKGISICVMNINVKKWYVKSSFLAKKVIDYYYRKVKPLARAVTKS